ncbi:MAG: hypothetical protein IKR00_02700, partial [Lachnospiraceae bacterium]|nr:hypothetical protein [Lachnospiraceae bacterium]
TAEAAASKDRLNAANQLDDPASETETNVQKYAFLGLQDMPECNYLDALSSFRYYMVIDSYQGDSVTEEIYVTDGVDSFRSDVSTYYYTIDGHYLMIDKNTGDRTEMEIDPSVLEQSKKQIEDIKNTGTPILSARQFQTKGKGVIPIYSNCGDNNEYDYYEYLTDQSGFSLTERYYMKDGDVFAIWNKSVSGQFETEKTQVIKEMTGEIPEGILEFPDISGSGDDSPEKVTAEIKSDELIATEQVAAPSDLGEEGGVLTGESGVSIEFTQGLFIPEETPLTISVHETVTDDEIGATYTAYDISMGDVHDLGGFVSIRIPYDDKDIEAGQDPARCVAGMYLNPDTGEWESVLYDVDTDAKELVIHTDHFSTYGCFVFKNEGKRSAKVAYIHEWMLNIDESQLAKALQEVIDNGGEPGVECRELLRPSLEDSFNALSEIIGGTDDKAAVAGNLTTLFVSGTGLGDLVGNIEWANGLTSALGYAGIATAVVNISTQALKQDKTDNDILGMYKSAVYLLASLSQSATLGTVGAAVWVIDKGLTEIGEYSYNKIADDTTKAYRHYYSKYMIRSKADWRWTLKDIARIAFNNQESADTAIMEEIDRWCSLFWDIDNDTYTNILVDIGQEGRGWPDEAATEAITASYKGDLLRLLEPVLEEVQWDLEQELWREQQKRLDEFQDKLNSTLTFEITEDIKGNQTQSQYTGYTIVLGPLSSGAVRSDWQSVMPANGRLEIQCTLIAWLLAGQPNEMRFYAPEKDPGKDEADKTISFQMTAPKTTISLGGQSGHWSLTDSGCSALENRTDGGGGYTGTFEASLYMHRGTYQCIDPDFPEDNYYVSYVCTLGALPDVFQPGESVSVTIEARAESYDKLIHGINCGIYITDGYYDQYFLPFDITSANGYLYEDELSRPIRAGSSPGPVYGFPLDAPWIEGMSDTVTISMPDETEEIPVFRIYFDSNAGESWFEYTWVAD